MKPIIEVKNLSKKYTLGERQPYYSFRDTISGIFHTPFRREKLEKDEFWALKDVSFDINKGDVVGVIGRNGAGKSTLLKILSQITPPTEGEVKLRGRVASLLEVGTGFHPELTGRENIYLNGAILGMKRWEINSKFREIVDFAEIEKFLDTPVKHYSSGMYMRLAFSVAAHLEPEILLVDEVLAVGDAQFQKKCLGKMSDVSKQGRTVLFVSHNMGAIEILCNKSILLSNGSIEEFDNSRKVISKYLSARNENSNSIFRIIGKPRGTEIIEIEAASINKEQSIDFMEQISLRLLVNNETKQDQLIIGISIENEGGQIVTSFHSQEIGCAEDKSRKINNGLNEINISLKNHLRPGKYFVNCSLFSRKFSKNYCEIKEAISFDIKNSNKNCYFDERQQGLFFDDEIYWKINVI